LLDPSISHPTQAEQAALTSHARRLRRRKLALVTGLLALNACATLDSRLDRDGYDQHDQTAQTEQARWQWLDANEQWSYAIPKQDLTIPIQNWVFEPQSIKITATAAAELNTYRDRPHTLVLRVYQLRTSKTFNEMRQHAAGVQYLLAAKAEALNSAVVEYADLVIAPGESATLTLDRQAETRHLGLVAGYFELDPKAASRLIYFPGMDDTPEVRYGLIDALTFGWFADTPAPLPRRPARLDIQVELGVQGIQAVAPQVR
jgi:type VI secretion system VasD/TssJ family lipoprotein